MILVLSSFLNEILHQKEPEISAVLSSDQTAVRSPFEMLGISTLKQPSVLLNTKSVLI